MSNITALEYLTKTLVSDMRSPVSSHCWGIQESFQTTGYCLPDVEDNSLLLKKQIKQKMCYNVLWSQDEEVQAGFDLKATSLVLAFTAPEVLVTIQASQLGKQSTAVSRALLPMNHNHSQHGIMSLSVSAKVYLLGQGYLMRNTNPHGMYGSLQDWGWDNFIVRNQIFYALIRNRIQWCFLEYTNIVARIQCHLQVIEGIQD